MKGRAKRTHSHSRVFAWLGYRIASHVPEALAGCECGLLPSPLLVKEEGPSDSYFGKVVEILTLARWHINRSFPSLIFPSTGTCNRRLLSCCAFVIVGK